MALIATPAAADADSYGTVAEANAYFASHWSEVKQLTWDALSTAQKERLLKTATNVIESLRFLDDYDGIAGIITKLDPLQRLSFPRNLEGIVPDEVKEAEFEQAVYLVNFDDSTISARMSGIYKEEVRAGSVSVSNTYGANYRGGGGQATYVAPLAVDLLRPYLRRNSRLVRA
jgi:hypothetical protein